MSAQQVFGMYIDADNVSPAMCDLAINAVKKLGEVRFVKAYGNFTCKPSAWKDICVRHGVSTAHRYNHTTSKNSADISLVIDAVVDTLKTNLFNTMVIVSSDSDFYPLIQRASLCGKKTIGFGERKAPTTYTKLCDEFHFFDDVQSTLSH